MCREAAPETQPDRELERGLQPAALGDLLGDPSPGPGLFSLGSPQEERPASAVPGLGHLRCHRPTPQPQQAGLQPAHLGLCLTREGLHWHTFRWSHYVLTASHPVPKSGRPLGNRAGPEAGWGEPPSPPPPGLARCARPTGCGELLAAGIPGCVELETGPQREQSRARLAHIAPPQGQFSAGHATQAGSTEPGVREGQGRWHLVAVQSPLLPVLAGGTSSDSWHPRVRIPFILPSL